MNASIQLFKNEKFGEVRVVEIEGKTYFVGNDVAKALGYVDPKGAISRHCRGALIQPLSDNQGVIRDTKIIPEGDIYRLAAKSELPGAEEFESWIFDEVLPSIRKHGGYLTPDKTEELLLNPDLIIQMATALKDERAKRAEVEAEKQRLLLTTQEQQKQLKEAAPKVEYFDDILSSKGLLTVNMIADCLGVSAIKLNKLLCEWNIQYSQTGTYHLFSRYRNMEYAEHKPHPYIDSNGQTKTRQHMYWTEAGKKFILELYNKKLAA